MSPEPHVLLQRLEKHRLPQRDSVLDYAAQLPDEHGWRPVDPASELVIALRNVELPTDL